ncbi:MAG: penicillin-binding transpeptidase domain-containing protein [Oligoflexales bacterium]
MKWIGCEILLFISLLFSLPQAFALELQVKPGVSARPTTLHWPLQNALETYLKNKRNPLAAVVVVDVASGKVLAIAEGGRPKGWSKGHLALYPSFPAASIFKTVSTAAALEMDVFHAKQKMTLTGGCANIHARGGWLRDVKPHRRNSLSLQRAYGNSCNGFFAKLAVNHVGLGNVLHYAEKLGWRKQIPADFNIPVSPMFPPSPSESNVQTVGRFAAGFGAVGLSAVHAAWLNLVVARDGYALPLSLYSDHPLPQVSPPLLSMKTTTELRKIMTRTVQGGTAGSVFRGRYRHLRRSAAGKTGTLTGRDPAGLTTWFAGMMPYEKPEVVVSAVVVTHDLWLIKAPHLAAEALRLWKILKPKQLPVAASQKKSKETL